MTTICLCIAWGLVIFAICRSYQVALKGKEYIEKLHQIPCSRCQYFTGSYYLKCTVNPCMALSEDAIGCRDFELAGGLAYVEKTSNKSDCSSVPLLKLK